MDELATEIQSRRVVPNLNVELAGECAECVCSTDARWRQAAVIVTTGTFLNGLIHCGENQYAAGRSGEPPSVLLGRSISAIGI